MVEGISMLELQHAKTEFNKAVATCFELKKNEVLSTILIYKAYTDNDELFDVYFDIWSGEPNDMDYESYTLAVNGTDKEATIVVDYCKELLTDYPTLLEFLKDEDKPVQ